MNETFPASGTGSRKSKLCLLLLSTLTACGLAARGQTTFVDFNTPGEYTNNFNPWNDNGGNNGGNYSFVESSTAGVGGSGGVSVFQNNDTTAICTNNSWDFSTNGATLTISVLIKANGQTSGNKVQLGILNTNNDGLNNNTGVAFESFRIIPTTSTTFSLREQFRSGGALTETPLGTINTVAGEWYKFVLTVTNVGGASGNYNAACAIYDFGTDGLTPGTNIVGFSTLMNHTGQTDITVPGIWPGLRAFQSGGIDAWDNFLVYTPASGPVFTIPLTNSSLAAGQSATFSVLAEGPGTMIYSWYTNGTTVSGATTSAYTTPSLTAGYTNIEVVASNGNGSATNSAAISVFVPAASAITNLPATAIQTTSATLNGQVISTGGSTPTVTLFYGPSDGGAKATAWSNSVNLGPQSAAFSQTISGLSPNTTYYSTAQAVNAAGTSWATPSTNFTTLPIVLATLTNLPVTAVQADSATLNGQILLTGNDVPSVTLYYGTNDGAANAAAWTQSIPLGQQTGIFAQNISSLSSNTTYYFAAAASNSAGVSWAQPSVSFTTALTNSPLPPSVAVLTQHNDNNRDGANLQETVLNTSNVNSNQFGLVFSRAVDDQVYAQPLIMTNVNVPGKGIHNLVIVATVNDSVYAFDADDSTVTTAYWHTSFLGPNARAPMNTDMTGACGGNYQDFSGKIGIVGTPVIDAASQTIYLVARTLENGTTFVQRLHALDVTTGQDKLTPVVIGATYSGTGAGSVGGVVSFDPQRANQRPGLALVKGVVYICWSSHCDWGPYHGWVIGYDAATFKQVAVYNDTPNGSNGGIWMSGQAPAADTNGNLFLSIGNGTVDTTITTDRGESFVKLTPSGTNLTVTSWFTPYNWPALEAGDTDLGSGGVLLIPGTSLLFSGGKEGVVYLVNKDNMGGLSAGTSDTNVVQTFSVTTDEVHGGAVWWNVAGGPYAYIWPSSVKLQQYRFNNGAGKFSLPATAQSPTSAPGGQPGGLLALSANGSQAGSGIIWAAHQLTGDANQSVRPGIIHAYDAENVANELWNSQMVPSRDGNFNFAKFVPPTVANGKVYLATFSGQLNVYGLLVSTTPAKLQVSPTNQNFGVVLTGQTTNQSVQVVNTGGLTLTGTVSATLPFKITAGSPFSLTAGQTGTVQVAFSPTASGSFSNVVVFTSNGGNASDAVTGSAITPAQLAVSPSSLNFGLLPVGTNAQASFTLTNLGGASLTNGLATIQGTGFTIVSGSPFSLPGFGSTNLTVRFTPTNSGSFSNVIVISSSAGGFTNALTGSAAIVPSAAFSGTPTTGAAPLMVAFTDTSAGTITNRFWDFGDNTTTNTSATAVNHSYEASGTNTVRLTVSGPVGTNTLVRTGYIVVTNLGPVSLSIQNQGSKLQLTWPAGTLQSANQVTGPYTNVTTATSPFTISPSNTTQFFRIKVR
ncbi:MAG TPA: choice-of-anchor D domain-containing protein [Verrucomicrobiae bacterium]|nr:choice-of-anchor D domain-containing protein [Verrucomicrobiae bacterium]